MKPQEEKPHIEEEWKYINRKTWKPQEEKCKDQECVCSCHQKPQPQQSIKEIEDELMENAYRIPNINLADWLIPFIHRVYELGVEEGFSKGMKMALEGEQKIAERNLDIFKKII